MMLRKNAFVNFFIFTIAFTEVASWTIDLPEIRKFLFEKNEKYKKHDRNEHEDYVVDKGQTFYSNIEGNSKHNSDHHEHHEKQDEHHVGYDHSYMEKKVYDIVSEGSTYLEGLRRSLEDYNDLLESCNRQNGSTRNTTSSNNSTSWRPQYDPPSSPMSNFTSSILTFDNYDSSVVPNRPNSSEPRSSSTRKSGRRLSCDEATEASENVRRYADLAMWATKRLQDLAYAKKYQKTDELEENELVLKLAWFLDRLAYLTGFEPEYKEYEPRETRTSTTPPTAQTLVPSSPELTKEMMDCLKRNSSEPATVRCRYPLQIPDLMEQVMNIDSTPSSAEGSPSDSDRVLPMGTGDTQLAQSSEILITADNTFPNSSPQKTIVTKRSTDYTYYFPSKPLHEVTYPAPIIKLIMHRLSNIKSIVKTIVEKRLAHIAEKKEEKSHFEKHFEKRSISDTVEESSNYINPISNLHKSVDKSIKKRPLEETARLEVLHYPVSDVSIINTKSFKKRSIDERRATPNFINRLYNLKSFIKSKEKGPIARKMFENFISSMKKDKHTTKMLHKRDTDNPMSKLANYYIKYKVWDNSNPIPTKKNKKSNLNVFEVKNHLNEPKVIQKRSLFNKKVVHLHIPKPLELFRTYAHTYKHTNYHTIHIPTLLSKLHKLQHDLKHKKLEKIHKKIKKRSIHYENMFKPRIPTDPQPDLSYYAKNKEGTNYNPSLVQAAQVRLGLEQIFQFGNIEVVRRFGANYNPLNPAPLYTGTLLTMADSF